MDKGRKYKSGPGEGEGDVLPNKLKLISKAEIEKEEARGFIDASVQLTASLTEETVFDTAYIMNMHKLALNHLYKFAGKFRTVNLSKGGFVFPAALHLSQSMETFQLEILDNLKTHYETDEGLIEDIAKVHGELLFIHPFREGNGRTARLLADLMAIKAGQDVLKFENLQSEEMFSRYIEAVQGVGRKDYGLMKKLIASLL